MLSYEKQRSVASRRSPGHRARVDPSKKLSNGLPSKPEDPAICRIRRSVSAGTTRFPSGELLGQSASSVLSSGPSYAGCLRIASTAQDRLHPAPVRQFGPSAEFGRPGQGASRSSSLCSAGESRLCCGLIRSARMISLSVGVRSKSVVMVCSCRMAIHSKRQIFPFSRFTVERRGDGQRGAPVKELTSVHVWHRWTVEKNSRSA